MSPESDARYMRAVVTARRDITGELWIVKVRPREPLVFKPGQYVTVGLPEGGTIVERPYSLASAPGEEELEFFLELVREGRLTPHLYLQPVGAEVFLRRSGKGLFLFDRNRARHFMMATVTGVAPFVSMIRHLAAQPASRAPAQVTLLQAASQPAELGYADELQQRARECGWFRYIPTVSRPWLAPGWSGETGRIEDVARKHLDLSGFEPSDTTVYLCGNPHMVANLKALLERARFPRNAIREELFWVA